LKTHKNQHIYYLYEGSAQLTSSNTFLTLSGKLSTSSWLQTKHKVEHIRTYSNRKKYSKNKSSFKLPEVIEVSNNSK